MDLHNSIEDPFLTIQLWLLLHSCLLSVVLNIKFKCDGSEWDWACRLTSVESSGDYLPLHVLTQHLERNTGDRTYPKGRLSSYTVVCVFVHSCLCMFICTHASVSAYKHTGTVCVCVSHRSWMQVQPGGLCVCVSPVVDAGAAWWIVAGQCATPGGARETWRQVTGAIRLLPWRRASSESLQIHHLSVV